MIGSHNKALVCRKARQMLNCQPVTNNTSSTTTTVTAVENSSSPPNKIPKVACATTLQIKLLSPNAQAPKRGSQFAAGYDIYASADTVVPRLGKAIVPTDISMAIPAGHYGRIAPRSGLAAKHSIDVGAGVIDEDYRGPLSVILFNFDQESDFSIKKGDRIAQLILERISTPSVEVVEGELSATVRGSGAFGSTGI